METIVSSRNGTSQAFSVVPSYLTENCLAPVLLDKVASPSESIGFEPVSTELRNESAEDRVLKTDRNKGRVVAGSRWSVTSGQGRSIAMQTKACSTSYEVSASAGSCRASPHCLIRLETIFTTADVFVDAAYDTQIDFCNVVRPSVFLSFEDLSQHK